MPASATTLVQQAYVGYVYGDSTCGQTALYEVGMTGIPVVNVNNNCSTGSTALYLARKAIASGDADCVLALGFEQMQAGALKSHWDDRPPTRERFLPVLRGLTADMDGMPQALRTFGGAGREYMQKLRLQHGDLRGGARQGQPPRGQQPARAVPQDRHDRRRDERHR